MWSSVGRSIGTSSLITIGSQQCGNRPPVDCRSNSQIADRGRERTDNALPVEPVEAEITFDVAELTIEGAYPRWRPPRYVLTLFRDALPYIPGYEDNPG